MLGEPRDMKRDPTQRFNITVDPVYDAAVTRLRVAAPRIRRALAWLAVGAFWLVLAFTTSWAGSFEFREEGKDFISLLEGKTPVLRYVKGEILPEGAPEDRRRSSYIHPLYSLDGVPISDDAPKDHYHHRGLSWMWLKVAFDGVTKDLWTLKGIHQRYVSHETALKDDSAVLKVTNYWEEDSAKRRLLNEVVTLTAHRADDLGRVIDFELTLSAVDIPVAIGVSATGYSGLNLRFAPRKDTTIATPRGRLPKDSNRERYAWADLSARYGGSDQFDGVTIFDNRANPHFPAGWCLRYYGDLNPAFTANSDDYVIEPGKPLTLRYRIYVHRGKADDATLHKISQQYNTATDRARAVAP